MSEPTITPEDVRIEFGAYCQPFVRRLPMNVEGGPVVEQRLAVEVLRLRTALTLATQRAEAAEVSLREEIDRADKAIFERDALRTDAAAKAAAKAMFEGDDQLLGKWTNAKPETREHYMRLARRALDAALAVPP